MLVMEEYHRIVFIFLTQSVQISMYDMKAKASKLEVD